MYAVRSTQPVHDLTGSVLLAETALMFGSLYKTKGELMPEETIGQILPRIVYKIGLELVKKGIMTQEEFLQILYDSKQTVEKEVINHDTIN